jgi:hypothetical protein
VGVAREREWQESERGKREREAKERERQVRLRGKGEPERQERDAAGWPVYLHLFADVC